MIKVIPAASRFYSEMAWLKTHWLFSFGHYYDPQNLQFGNLRVYNDDRIAPHQGFDEHPHREMEIVTLIFQGRISHRDSMGNKTTIGPNEVQRMSAGTGIVHAEFNDHDEEIHLHQIWFLPKKSGLKPSYSQQQFTPEDWSNKITLLASGKKTKNALHLNADASMSRCALTQGHKVHFKSTGNVFIYLMEGQLEINGTPIKKGDQARITEATGLEISSLEDSDFILIES